MTPNPFPEPPPTTPLFDRVVDLVRLAAGPLCFLSGVLIGSRLARPQLRTETH